MFNVYKQYANGSVTTSPAFSSENLSEAKKAAESLKAQTKNNYAVYEVNQVWTTQTLDEALKGK